jgi:two-component system, NarL family, response regulator NreC
MSSLRILVADDNETIRMGLCSVLESRAGWIVCGQAADGKDAVEKAIELRPDVILVDLSMPRLNGFEVAQCVYERMPDCRILVVTEHDPHLMAQLSAQSGVSGFVAKSRIGLDLLSAVEAASNPSHLRSSLSAQKTA